MVINLLDSLRPLLILGETWDQGLLKLCVVWYCIWICVLDEVIIDLLNDLLPLNVLCDYACYRWVKSSSLWLRHCWHRWWGLRNFLLLRYQRSRCIFYIRVWWFLRCSIWFFGWNGCGFSNGSFCLFCGGLSSSACSWTEGEGVVIKAHICLLVLW